MKVCSAQRLHLLVLTLLVILVCLFSLAPSQVFILDWLFSLVSPLLFSFVEFWSSDFDVDCLVLLHCLLLSCQILSSYSSPLLASLYFLCLSTFSLLHLSLFSSMYRVIHLIIAHLSSSDFFFCFLSFFLLVLPQHFFLFLLVFSYEFFSYFFIDFLGLFPVLHFFLDSF